MTLNMNTIRIVNYEVDMKIFQSNYPKKEGWLIFGEWYDVDYLGGKESLICIIVDDETGIADFFQNFTGHSPATRLKIDQNGKYFPVE